MKAQSLIRQFLELFTAHEPLTERICSCGDANHVRLQLFRADGRPVLAILPEATELTLEQFRDAANAKHVEAFTDAELDALCLETELGCSSLLENPFGSDVFFDESLLLYPSLVVCPKMFGGKEGECYRIDTRELVEGARPLMLRMASAVGASDDWAV